MQFLLFTNLNTKMKKNAFILMVLFAFVSCEDQEPETTVAPDWLTPRLAEIENSGECEGCAVQRWEYNDEYFYQLYCSFGSCVDCEVYNSDGKLVVWGEDVDPVHFQQNKKRPEKIWECSEEINAN